ncbi:lipoyl(octanoyl) transferase LipB [Thermomicrobium sp. 4228-Ro]|uniref:lipoyl(octanoyl) transferase LipB n=1 Tax=Thermomicrobium sp. 4228-Ro TaxID=2993937 RepID=UPI0022489F75|nr:lipoyl(octanoyl) transferase LipB [Thermomicrobium sp. 4228-Ro]MCX2726757.1 lipoyl(octanoyl) transferase LipB [Thermomicrobium sp. 4228-Ro]
MASEPVVVLQLGRVEYRETWELQRQLAAARRAGTIPDTVLLLEHEPVFTTGRRGGTHNLRLSLAELAARGVPYYVTDRGGDVTYHGPGQLVAYVILRLGDGQRRVRRFVECLEATVLDVLAAYGLAGWLDPAHPGVWVGNDKIAAIGIAIHHGVTYHGIALNVTTDLEPYSWIVPCGIADRGVTSLAQQLGRPVELGEVARRWLDAFAQRFERDVQLDPEPVPSLAAVLERLTIRRAAVTRS